MKSLGVPAYRGSLAAGMRMFFQAILESLDIDDGLKIDRIIYLDSDTVVEGSLINLMNIDLQGKPVGMVIDSLSGSYKTTIGIPEDEPYYNSGVIIFDVDAWKDNKYSDQIIEELNKGNGKSANPDQDLLNTVCIGNIFTLPVIYNVQPIHLVFTPKQYFSCFSRENYYSEEELGCLQDSWIISGSDHYEEKGRNKQRDSEMRPVIYHFFRFMGEFPWNVGNTHPDRERYKYYLSLTPWKDKPDEPCDFGFISIVEKSLNRLLPAGLFIHIFHFAHNKYLSRKMEIN